MSKNIKTGIDNIYLGLFLHYLAWTIPIVLSKEIEIVTAILCSIGWVYIIKGFNKYKGHRRLQFSGLYRFLFVAYLIVTLVMIIRGYTIDYEYQWISFKGMINFTFFNTTYILPYIMPLIVFIPFKETNLSIIVKFSVVASILMIICAVLQHKTIIASSLNSESGGQSINGIYAPFTFVTLLYLYIRPKKWYYNVIAFTFMFVIAIISARRGSSAIYASLFIIGLYNWSNNIKSNILRFFSKFVAIAIVIYGINIFSTSSLTSFIRNRGLEDNRSHVDEALLSQMNEYELVFGKGLNGRYYFPLLENDYQNGWRYGTETGFYNIVLKGGYLMAILHIIVLLYPALLGIFKSRNNLCKMLGAYIIISLLELYPFGHLTFNFKFLIIWTGVLLCYKQTVREMTDKQIKQLLFK